jgi:hypothetical protein
MTVVGFIVTGVIEDSHLNKGNPIRYVIRAVTIWDFDSSR